MDTAAAAGAASGQKGVRDTAGLGDITPEALGETFPHWGICHLSGAWWAMREGVENFIGLRSLIQRVLVAGDLTVLPGKLCLQEYPDGLDLEDLAAVYRDMLLPGAAR